MSWAREPARIGGDLTPSLKGNTTVIKTTLRLAVPLAVAATALAAGVPAVSAAPADRPAPTSAATTSAVAGPAVAGITGSARMDYPVQAEEIRIIVDARGLFTAANPVIPVLSWGMFRIQHRMSPPLGLNWGDFKVDCVRVDGPDVTVTGRIVDAGPYWQEFLHRKQPLRMGLSFHVATEGGAPTRIGMSRPTAAGQPLMPKCTAPAPDTDAIEGGYTVTDTRS